MFRFFIIIVFLFSAQVSIAQYKPFIIKGIVDQFPDKTIVKLRDVENNKWIDSTFINNRQFTLKAIQPKYNHASQYFLFVGDRDAVIPILIENNEVLKLEFNDADFQNYSILAAKNQHEYEELDSVFYEPYTTIIKNISLINTFKKQGSKKNIKQFKTIINAERNKVNNEILHHKGSFVAMHYIANYINVLQPKKDILIEFLNSFDINSRNSKYAKAIQYYINPQKALLDDEMFDPNNSKINLGETFTRKYILLDIASYYCNYSQMARKNLEKIVQKYSTQLDVVSIHVDNDLEGLRNYSTNHYPNWKFYYHPEGRFSNFYIKYQIIGTPTYYLFDQNKKLITSFQNNAELEKQLSMFIK